MTVSCDSLPELWALVADAFSGRVTDLVDPPIVSSHWSRPVDYGLDVSGGVVTVTLTDLDDNDYSADCPQPADTDIAASAVLLEADWRRAAMVTFDPTDDLSLYITDTGHGSAPTLFILGLRLAILTAVFPSMVAGFYQEFDYGPRTSIVQKLEAWNCKPFEGSFERVSYRLYLRITPLQVPAAPTYTMLPVVGADYDAPLQFTIPQLPLLDVCPVVEPWADWAGGGNFYPSNIVPVEDGEPLNAIMQWSGMGGSINAEEIDALHRMAEVLNTEAGNDHLTAKTTFTKGNISSGPLTVTKIAGQSGTLPKKLHTVASALRRLAAGFVNRFGADFRVYDAGGNGVGATKRVAVLRGDRD